MGVEVRDGDGDGAGYEAEAGGGWVRWEWGWGIERGIEVGNGVWVGWRMEDGK